MQSHPVILIADDDETDVFLLRRAFEKIGLANTLVHVSDGEEAINYLSARGRFQNRFYHPVPNLLLLDLKMPRLSGFDVLNWLRTCKELEDLPVVVLTNSDLDADLNEAWSLGAKDYLVKGSDPEKLVEVAKEIATRCLTAQCPQKKPPVRPSCASQAQPHPDRPRLTSSPAVLLQQAAAAPKL